MCKAELTVWNIVQERAKLQVIGAQVVNYAGTGIAN